MTWTKQLEGTILGRYKLVRFIGAGGMAAVFEARHQVLEQPVAVKVMVPQLGSGKTFFKRFLREAKVMASLEHPHILSVRDFGEHDQWSRQSRILHGVWRDRPGHPAQK